MELKLVTSVLFVCVENAAASIMAESILRSMAGRRFRAYSAGIHPAAEINAPVLEFLHGRRLPTEGLRPKRLAECPRVEFVITLCPRAEAALPESWPGDPVIAHWGIDEEDLWDVFWVLQRRIKIFTSLPHGTLPRRSIERRVKAMPAWQ